MPPSTTLRIGTRGSALARRQAESVAEAMRAVNPRIDVRLVEIATAGDRQRSASLSRIGGMGVFVKDLEEALLAGRVDIAVHSLKDMPTAETVGLVVAATPPREDPRDALVSRMGAGLSELPSGALVGTSSARRAAQVRGVRPDVTVADIRGNVDTRLRKLAEGQYDAIVLAMAGLQRLGLAARATEVLDSSLMLPAPGQGALALQVRSGDEAALAAVGPLNHTATHAAVRAERALLASLGGGCLLPIGAYATVSGSFLHLRAAVIDPTGTPAIRDELRGDSTDPEGVAMALAKRLIEAGAQSIISTSEPAT